MNKKTRSEIISSLVEANRKDLADKLTVTSSPLGDFIANLNKDLALEYGAMIQYIQHAACVTGPEMIALIEELKKHAKEEHEHAVLLSDRINYLGGVPSMGVGDTKTSMDSNEMIKQDLEGERVAIERYTQRIKEAEALNDPGTVEILRDILGEEQEHEADLMIAVKTESSKTKEMIEPESIKGV